MPYLKSARSSFYPDITLTELSALQRLQYLEYIAGEESWLKDQQENALDLTRLSAMNIRVSARLVALALLKNRTPDLDILDDNACRIAADNLQREVLATWSWEGIAASALQVRELSGMLPAEEKNTPQEPDPEPISAGKPLPGNVPLS